VILAPSFCCAAKFYSFPAQSGVRLDSVLELGKRGRRDWLWIAVYDCAKKGNQAKKLRAQEPCDSRALVQLRREVFEAPRLNLAPE
jgi:hypothetical protein